MRTTFKFLVLIIGICSVILVLSAQQVPSLSSQTADEAATKSSGCTSSNCHVNTEPMHVSESVRLGCTDCHGGNAQTRDKLKAHVSPSNTDIFKGTGGPIRAYTAWLRESTNYVRFVNPGDFRVQDQTCGSSGCHEEISLKSRKSMMTHGGVLWGAAVYNNGAFPLKDTLVGESYSRNGEPQMIRTMPAPTDAEKAKGVLPLLVPLPEWAI